MKRAVITHVHADHAREGSIPYLCTRKSKPLLIARLGSEIQIETLEYGRVLPINAVRIFLHPAVSHTGVAQAES
ncbi:MAG: hypothetical protein P8X85_16995 [Desulfobacterales bacterium]